MVKLQEACAVESGFVAELHQFLLDPSAERFCRLRDAFARSPGYAPYSTTLNEGQVLLADGRFEEAADFLLSVMPNWILNPGIHALLGFALSQSGKEEDARYEYTMAAALLRGILSTGDGSEARPYLVLYTQDEYDLLRYLKMQPHRQSLRQKETGHFDVQTCDDGLEIWFDVTVPLTHLQNSLPGTR